MDNKKKHSGRLEQGHDQGPHTPPPSPQASGKNRLIESTPKGGRARMGHQLMTEGETQHPELRNQTDVPILYPVHGEKVKEGTLH